MPNDALTPDTDRIQTFAQENAELSNLWERDTHGLGFVAHTYMRHPYLEYPIFGGILLVGAATLGGWSVTLLGAIQPFGEIPKAIWGIVCVCATIALTALLRWFVSTIREFLWVRAIRAQYTKTESALQERYGARVDAASGAPPWRKSALPLR